LNSEDFDVDPIKTNNFFTIFFEFEALRRWIDENE